MAAARTSVRGLSTEELETIRGALAAGRRPKVMFTAAAGQIAGQFGQVVELTDPARSDEWVVVRFGKDELPFSPSDLAIPPKNAPARRPSSPKSAPAPELPAPELKLTQPPVPPSRKEQKMPTSTVQTPPASSPSPGGKSSEASSPATADDAGADPGSGAQARSGEGRPARRAAKAAKAKAPAGLMVTLAYAEGEWTVAANQGSKALAKPYVIKPADALRMVSLLDVAAVHEAVEQIVSSERAEAEQQADRLRAELAEIEARLAELREAG